MKTYIGIDPGQKGGIALLNATSQLWQMMDDPVSLQTLFYRLRSYSPIVQKEEGTDRDIIAVVERAQTMPKQGIVGAFTYGKHYGMLLASLAAAGIPYVEIPPATWKKEILVGVRDKKDKKQVIVFCQKLFPLANLIPEGCRVEKDGLAEALLLAEYGRRKNL